MPTGTGLAATVDSVFAGSGVLSVPPVVSGAQPVMNKAVAAMIAGTRNFFVAYIVYLHG